MSITVKLLTRRSGGRVSIKPTPIDKDEIIIGRATDCDAYLSDLRVSLRHARLIRLSGDKVVIEALGERPITIGKTPVQRREIAVDGHEEIRVGPYSVTLEAGEGDDDLSVILELVDPVQETVRPEDAKKVFHLRGGFAGIRRLAWGWALVVLLPFLVWPLVSFFSSDHEHEAGKVQASFADQSWLSGGMSMAHSNLVDNCKDCHQQPFVAVKDDVCLDCHIDIRNHAKDEDLKTARPAPGVIGSIEKTVQATFNLPEGRCGSCHKEHNGHHGVIPQGQAFCSDCHTDMDARFSDTDLINASDFGTDHPEFRASVVTEPMRRNPVVQRISLDQKPRERSGVKFPHKMHLEAGKGVARMAKQLSAEYGFQDVLQCSDCHTLDAGGALFNTMTMEDNCAMCHSLAFDKEGAVDRELPHGKPKEVIAVMRDYYLAEAIKGVADVDESGMSRRRPGRAFEQRDDNRRQIAFEQAQDRTRAGVRQIFSEGGACYDCHVIETPVVAGSLDYNIAPVSLADQFMPKAWFSHKSHATANLECGTCHEAETSETAQDVLMPGIESCRDCHGGEMASSSIPSTCTMCHDYHDDDHAPFMTSTFKHATAGGTPVAAPDTE